MCGRYTLQAEADELIRRFGIKQLNIPIAPRYNIAPSQMVPVITCEPGEGSGKHKYMVDAFRWGIQARMADSANKLIINARMETLLQKPMFKNLFLSNRCVVPASGFYEWNTKRARKGHARPFAINVDGGELVGFAGLWRPTRDAQGAVQNSCVIITVPANDKLEALHDRMPAILMPGDEHCWLDPDCADSHLLLSLLRPYPHSRINFYPVSTMVNSTRIDARGCLLPVEEDTALKVGHTQLSIFDRAID